MITDRARTDLARLAAARPGNDGFRGAAAILRRVIGFDGWYWLLTDPGARLPTRDLGENVIAASPSGAIPKHGPSPGNGPPGRSP